MGAKRYLLWAEWLNNLMIFMLWHMGTEWVFSLLKLKTSPVLPVMTGLILLCAYLCRVYVDKLLVFFGIHCLEAVILLFLPVSIQYKVVCLLIWGIISLCDLFFWTGDGDRSFSMIHPVAVLFILTIFAYASWHDISGLVRGSYVCGILFVSLFFIRTYLLNAIKLASDMQMNTATPLDEMLKNNGLMVLLLVIFFTLFMFFIRSESLAYGLRTLIRSLSGLIRKILLFVLKLFVKEDAGGAQVSESVGFSPDLTAVSAIPMWVLTLLQAVEKVLIISVLAFFVYFVLKGLAAFIRLYFYRHGYDLKMMENEDYIDVNERIRPGIRHRARRLFTAGDERERIRRKYKREVETLRRGGYVLKRDHTPRERAIDVGDDDFGELTEKYENLRYGKE
ncbi:MAG TPA: hypothetical protein DIS78_06620 [Lachnospiraceae bacterium]|nr:hypothetical protein [Lachnospiraceae bacterium]